MTGFSGGRRFSFDPPDRPLELPYAEPAGSSRQREYPARPTASLARCGAGATRVPQDGPRALAAALERTITVDGRLQAVQQVDGATRLFQDHKFMINCSNLSTIAVQNACPPVCRPSGGFGRLCLLIVRSSYVSPPRKAGRQMPPLCAADAVTTLHRWLDQLVIS
jgi:hypothetical protein